MMLQKAASPGLIYTDEEFYNTFNLPNGKIVLSYRETS